MKYILSILLIACCVLALYFSLHFIFSKEKRRFENRLYSVFCIASAIWSFGFGGLILQTNTRTAYIWCAIGMIGVFLYLSCAQLLMCHMAEIKNPFRYYLNGFSFTGFIIYFFITPKDQRIYYIDKFGMTYHFTPGFWNTIYTVYSVIMAFHLIFSLIYMFRTNKTHRSIAFCKKAFLAEAIIFLGMIIDTVCPLLGIPAVPGSSATQFIGLIVLYHAALSLERSRINISNMSEFIYYSLEMPVLVYDTHKKLRILNDAAYTFFDIKHEDAGICDIGIEQLFDLEAEDDIFSFEGTRHITDANCRNNSIYCHLSISEIDDSYGDTIGFIVLVTDLSEHMKSLQDLQNATAEAQAANQAKSTFLANMSHEIRTPMNAIIGFSELVLKMDIADDVKEYVTDIKQASHNLLAIINDILDISKIESGKMELVCNDYYVSNVLSSVSLIIANQAKEKGLDFTMHVDPSIPTKLYGDKVRIRSVLINILNNAVKYTKRGSVTLDISVKSITEDTVILAFKCSDTGIGIKQENLDALFQTFEQIDLKNHYEIEGSGLGLAIAKGYVSLMDGDITVESVYGKGSVFTVTISQEIIDSTPIDLTPTQANNPVNRNSIGNMRIFGIRVLVVDDNLVNLKVASSSLRYYGLEVDTASNGFDAIELCRHTHYPIVFLDHMMPDLDGVETMKQIRLSDPYYSYNGEGKLIVLTANAVSGVRNQLMEAGFDEYLGKPMNFKQLERLLSQFLPKECITYQEETSTPSDTQKPATENFTFLKETLSDVDISQGLDNCGGKLEDYLNVLEITYHYGGTQLSELMKFHEQHDYSNYTVKVHSLKSSARNIGANMIADMAMTQEDAGRSQNYGYIDLHKEDLLSAYRILLANIKQVLLHYERIEADTDEASREYLSEKTAYLILLNIRHSIDDFDFTKVFDILEKLKKYRFPPKYEETFQKLNQLMDVLDVENILILLKQALNERE